MMEEKMEYVYAAMLLHKAGKEITESGVKNVLSAAGIAVDEARVKALVAALQSVNIADAIQKAAVVAPVAVAASAGAPVHAEEKKKEGKSKEEEKKSEEAAAAGLGALFG